MQRFDELLLFNHLLECFIFSLSLSLLMTIFAHLLSRALSHFLHMNRLFFLSLSLATIAIFTLRDLKQKRNFFSASWARNWVLEQISQGYQCSLVASSILTAIVARWTAWASCVHRRTAGNCEGTFLHDARWSITNAVANFARFRRVVGHLSAVLVVFVIEPTSCRWWEARKKRERGKQ